MKIYSSYKVQIKHYNHIFEQTVEVYRNAVSFFIDICDKEWDNLVDLRSQERSTDNREILFRDKEKSKSEI